MKIFRFEALLFTVATISVNLIFAVFSPFVSAASFEVRPVSGISVTVPAASEKQFVEEMGADDSGLVRISGQEFSRLAARINALIAERGEAERRRRAVRPFKKTPPAACFISAVTYEFVKNGESVTFEARVDFTVLADAITSPVQLFGGRIALVSAELDGAAPALSVGPDPAGGAGNRYALCAAGKGDHTLTAKFAVQAEKSSEGDLFTIVVPDCPKNKVAFTHDFEAAAVRIRPAVGVRETVDPASKKRRVEGYFGNSNALSVAFRPLEAGEKQSIERAEKAAVSPASEKKAEAPAAAPVAAEEKPAFRCDVESLYSFGDETISGRHVLHVNVIKGGLKSFSVLMPAGAIVEDVSCDDHDRTMAREEAGRSSFEIFLKSPKAGEFYAVINSAFRIPAGAKTAELPEVEVAGAAGERGFAAVCANSNVKIELSGDPEGIERIDSYELPDGMRFSTVAPVLFSFKYSAHPYGAKFVLTRLEDSEVLSTLVTGESINTVVTPGGGAISRISLDVKNSGRPNLRLFPSGTVEVLDSSVDSRPVRVSIDRQSNFRVPLVRSEIRDGAPADFPVRVKTAADIEALSRGYGRFEVKMPKLDVPAMSFEWRVFAPDGYVFFDISGGPGLRQPSPYPVIYQIPLNIALMAAEIAGSENAPAYVFMAFVLAMLFYFGSAVILGFERAAALMKNIFDFAAFAAGEAVDGMKDYLFQGMVVVAILGILVAVSMPQFAAMTEDAKSTKAKQDCDTIAQAISKYNSLEGAPAENLSDLKGKYLTNIEWLKDPWGRLYEMNARERFVFSKGPDGRAGTKDDVRVYYADPTLMAETEASKFRRVDRALTPKGESKTPAEASRKGIYSVPVNMIKTASQFTLVKKFVMPGQDVHIGVSYMSAGFFRSLLAALIALGMLLPVFAGRAFGRGKLLAPSAAGAAAIIAAVEAANQYIPQTAYYSQAGMLAGVAIMIVLRAVKYFSDPGTRDKIAAIFFRSENRPETPAAEAGAGSGSGAALTAVALAIAATISFTLCGPAKAAQTSGGAESGEVYFNPATLEIETYHRGGEALFGTPRHKPVYIRYSELRFMLDSVKALQDRSAKLIFPEPPAESVAAEPRPAKEAAAGSAARVNRISIRGDVDSKTADLRIEYSISVSGEDYVRAELASGDVALATSESALAGRPERRDPVRVVSSGPSCCAVFDEAGEYIVRFSLRAPVESSEDNLFFNLVLPNCPLVAIEVSTPANYEFSAPGLIAAERRAVSPDRAVTRGNLVPSGSYRFKMTLGEKARNERFQKMREAERARALAEAAKTDEARLLAKKTEPRVLATSVQVVTVEDGRLSSTAVFHFDVRNTQLRDVSLAIPVGAAVTGVSASDEISDWSAASSLNVTFKKPLEGSFSVSASFELPFGTRTGEVEFPVSQALVAGCEQTAYLAVDSAINADVAATLSDNLVAVDEREIPVPLSRRSKSPLLYSCRASRFPAVVSLGITRNADLPSTPVVVDHASYKTFVMNAGYAITSAYYRIRNNNVQFLEIRLPKNSKTWSLKVGGRLVKPARDAEGSAFVPLLKSPLCENEFKPFVVELVYVTKVPEFDGSGARRFEAPRLAVICSRVDWKFYFMDEYRISGIASNMRQVRSFAPVEFMEGDGGKPLSVDDIVALQGRMMGGAAGGDADKIRFGGRTRGFLPVSAEFPELSSKAVCFSGEVVKTPGGIESAPQFYIEFAYRSVGFYKAVSFAGFFFGAVFAAWAFAACFGGGRYKLLFAFGAFAAVFAMAMTNFDPESMNYLFAGLFMGLILPLVGMIAGKPGSPRLTRQA